MTLSSLTSESRPDAPPSSFSENGSTGKPKAPLKAIKLPFDRADLDARTAILKAVWAQLQPLIGRSTSYSDWRARNSRVAMSFAVGHFEPQHILAAWEDCSKERGEPVRELALVQKFLQRIEAGAAVRRRKGAPP